MGDIHGAHKSLLQCLRGVNFDYDNDQLIFLGDVVDGWSGVIDSIEELLKIKNLISIRGNHDDWALSYIKGYMIPINDSWLHHGGRMTKFLLDNNPDKVKMVREFIENSIPYHIDDDNNVFTHAGFNQNGRIEYTSHDDLMWSRKMVRDCHEKNTDESSHYNPDNKYNKIYVGHTPTSKYGFFAPTIIGKNVVMMDNGAAFKGNLTIMNIEDGSYFQSTPYLLYPNENGRN